MSFPAHINKDEAEQTVDQLRTLRDYFMMRENARMNSAII